MSRGPLRAPRGPAASAPAPAAELPIQNPQHHLLGLGRSARPSSEAAEMVALLEGRDEATENYVKM